jgi:hypothetical protein
MAKDRTAKSCYESAYGGGWVTARQRLAEMACERIAGTQTLGTRFWMQEPWDKVFRREQALASRLIDSPFSVEAIMRAWVSPRGRNVRTLGAPFFRPIVEIEQRKLDLELNRLETAPVPEIINTQETPRPMKRVGRSVREKLADAPTERGLFGSDEEG